MSEFKNERSPKAVKSLVNAIRYHDVPLDVHLITTVLQAHGQPDDGDCLRVMPVSEFHENEYSEQDEDEAEAEAELARLRVVAAEARVAALKARRRVPQKG